MKTFESTTAYVKFVMHVKNTNRYILGPWCQTFLETLLATSKSRQLKVASGSTFWRSQLGEEEPRPSEWEEGVYYDHHPKPYSEERMKPLIYAASEGRANPKGIPYIYVSTDKETAMSECRPWLGSNVSLGMFQTLRDLILIDCSKEKFAPISEPRYREQTNWYYINEAFAEPITPSDNTADYVPTQVIAEFFKSKKYDGIKYRSSLGEGCNIVLFDLNVVELAICYLYKVTNLSYSFKYNHRYYKTSFGESCDIKEP